MGAWGPGNFDGDSALDWYLIKLGKPLAEKLRGIASDPVELEPDEHTCAELLCGVEVLTALHARVHPILSPREELADWKARLLLVFAAFHASDPDGAAERRRIAVKTFDAAIRRAESDPSYRAEEPASAAKPRKAERASAKKAKKSGSGPFDSGEARSTSPPLRVSG